MSREQREPAWLDAALRELAESDEMQQAPARVEQSLRAALRARPVYRPRRQPALWWLAAAAAALATWGVLQDGATRRMPSADEPSGAGPYLALVEGEPLGELDAVQVVRVRLPGSVLARLGAPIAAPGADPVEAQVILGQDGVARAIRFVE